MEGRSDNRLQVVQCAFEISWKRGYIMNVFFRNPGQF